MTEQELIVKLNAGDREFESRLSCLQRDYRERLQAVRFRTRMAYVGLGVVVLVALFGPIVFQWLRK